MVGGMRKLLLLLIPALFLLAGCGSGPGHQDTWVDAFEWAVFLLFATIMAVGWPRRRRGCDCRCRDKDDDPDDPDR